MGFGLLLLTQEEDSSARGRELRGRRGVLIDVTQEALRSIECVLGAPMHPNQGDKGDGVLLQEGQDVRRTFDGGQDGSEATNLGGRDELMHKVWSVGRGSLLFSNLHSPGTRAFMERWILNWCNESH